GMWFNPQHNGEGWTIEELPDGRALVYWFTYDDSGEQAWTIGVGYVGDAQIAFAENLRPVGTRFGGAFDPNQVVRGAWGQLAFAFANCNEASMTYASSIAAFGAETLKPIRLTHPAGTVCLDAKPTVPTNGAWR